MTTAQNGIGSQTEPCLSLCCLIISITFCRSLLEFSSCSNHTILSEYASPVSRIASSDQTNTTTLATRMQQCKYSNTVSVVKTQSKSRTAFQPALSYLAHTNLTILDIHYWLLDLWKSAAACESDLLSLYGTQNEGIGRCTGIWCPWHVTSGWPCCDIGGSFDFCKFVVCVLIIPYAIAKLRVCRQRRWT